MTTSKTVSGRRIRIAAIAAAIFILHPSSFIPSASADTLYTNIVITTSPTLVLTSRFDRVKAIVRPEADCILYYGDTATTNALATKGMYTCGTNQWYETKKPTVDNGVKWFQTSSGSVTCRVEDVYNP